MYSSISYYAVLANLLYTFNLVNYPELSAIKNQLANDFHKGKTPEEAFTDINKGSYADLGDLKIKFELADLFSSNTNWLFQISKFHLPLNKIAQVLLWTIAVYFVSIQVYNILHQQNSPWKRCFIILGFGLAFFMENSQYLVPLKPASDWKNQPFYLINLQLYDLLFMLSVTLNIIFIICLIFKKPNRITLKNQNGLAQTLKQNSCCRSKNSTNHIHSAFEQKRNTHSNYNTLLMSRFIGTHPDFTDGIPIEEDRISAVSSTISERSSFYCSSSMAPRLSAQSKLQTFQSHLRATCITPSRSPVLYPIVDSVSEIDSYDIQPEEQPPDSDVD